MSSGVLFDLANPRVEDVIAYDVARGLLGLGRFNGQAVINGVQWTVLHHSLAVARLVAYRGGPPGAILHALVHDAHEAYVGDVVSPLKPYLGARWAALEGTVEAAVLEAFGATRHDDWVKPADREVCLAEGNLAGIGGFAPGAAPRGGLADAIRHACFGTPEGWLSQVSFFGGILP